MELPVIDFIRTRLEEADSTLDTRPGSAYYDMFVKPQETMLQPIMDQLELNRISQSIRQILNLEDPDAFDEEAVDDLISNLYVTRDGGAVATTTVRVYYTQPLDKEFPALTAEFASSDLSFFNANDFRITSAEMALQTEGSLFYIEMAVRSQAEGDSYNVAAGAITAFVNDQDAVRVTNPSPATGGLPRETNTQVLVRAQNSIGVRDLETVKGINAILREKFPYIRRIQSIGMADPEMMRDILYNVHVGGKTDVYIRTPSLTTASMDFVGLDYDKSREISRQIHIQMARSATDSVLPADVGTPNIIAGSVVVREDLIETAASIESVAVPPGTGIDLTGKEWLRFEIDDLGIFRIRVAGANIAQTQRFEIINTINANVGREVAFAAPGNKIRLTSTTVGAGSVITFTDPQTSSPPPTYGNAADVLFNLISYPYTKQGDAAEYYVEGPTADYVVNYEEGLIYQTSYPGTRVGPTIMSGQTMISSENNGQIALSGGNFTFKSSIVNRFLDGNLVKVRAGDEVTIENIDGFVTGTVLGDLPQTFFVTEVISANELRLLDFNPTGPTYVDQVQYSIKSNQVVVIDYKFNPISIDVGSQVLLADGYNRGIRPGRTSFTIPDTPFINILSIQEIDPESGDTIADPLLPPRGYGYGGYGMGGYGIGQGGDYDFLINAPRDRYSVYDDAVIIFKPDALSRSYRVTYNWVPDIVPIHDVSRNDLERVTGADVLPKNFVPAFFEVEIGIRRDTTNVSAADNETLAQQVADYVNLQSGESGVQASEVIKILENGGLKSVRTPFTMRATVLNTDGSTTILESEDVLSFPEVSLSRDTDNYVTKRIVCFYAESVVLTEVS